MKNLFVKQKMSFLMFMMKDVRLYYIFKGDVLLMYIFFFNMGKLNNEGETQYKDMSFNN